jgi:hypothetical protein
MKHIYALICLVLFVTNNSFSQFIRHLNATEKQFNYNLNTVVSIQNKVHFVDIKGSNSNVLKIDMGILDDDGNSSNYQTISQAINPVDQLLMLGVYEKANNEVVFCIGFYNQLPKRMQVKFYTANIQNWSITEIYEHPKLYHLENVQIALKDNHLVGYFTDLNSNSVVRLAFPINNLTNYSEEQTGLLISDLTQSMTNYKEKQIKTIGTDEFCNSHTYMIKRSFNGIYSYKKTGNLYNINYFLNANSIDLLTDVYYKKYDFSFNLLDSVKIDVLVNLSTKINYCYKDGSNIVVFTRSKRIVLNSNFQLVHIQSEHDYRNSKVLNGGIYFSNYFPSKYYFNEQSLIGNYVSVFSFEKHALTLPKNIDYNQLIETSEIEFNTGHCNIIACNEMNLTSGMNLKTQTSNKSLLFLSSNRVVGINENNDTVGLFSKYFNSTCVPGPYTPKAFQNNENIDFYNRGYYVSREMINNHILELNNQNSSYKIPFGIKFWPAHGNINLGQSANLAPFIDQNNNGIYEPELGDYPEILGDQCVLNIYAQLDSLQANSGIEAHQFIFTFDCDTNEILSKAVFVKEQFHSRTQHIYKAHISTFSDFDIGTYYDDFSGTDVQNNLIYSMNGDMIDENNSGKEGFQYKIPVVGTQILQGMKLKKDTLDNLFGILENESINGIGFGDEQIDNEFSNLYASNSFNSTSNDALNDPKTIGQMYLNMEGKSSNGLPRLVGNDTIRHAYFGNSDPYHYSSSGVDIGENFTELDNFHSPGDRRMLASTDKGDFLIGDTLNYFTAHFFALDSIYELNSNSANKLRMYAERLKNQFKNNDLGCGKSFNKVEATNQYSGIGVPNELEISIYPNPFTDEIKIGKLVGKAIVSLFDLNGKVLLTKEIENQTALNLSALKSSIYFLKVQQNGIQKQYKIVKY